MTTYYQNVDIDFYRQRLILVIFLMFTAFVLLLTRLFFLQMVEGATYRRLSQNNCIRLQHIQPSRGLIFDRSGKRLVDNRPAFDLSVIPKDAGDIDQTLSELSRLTGFPLELLKQRFRENRSGGSYKPVPLIRDMGRDMLAVVEAHKFDLPGVEVNFQPRRHYLHRDLAAHVTGYLGKISPEEIARREHAGYETGSRVGKTGVEKTYDAYLRGERGGRQVEVNAAGQVVRVLKTVPARPGDNLYLTIDYSLQQQAETLLAGRSGAVVAMDPMSGDVLAMASSPAYDLNDFVDGLSRQEWEALVSNPRKPLQNKAIQAEYPPGSVYKLITVMAGWEEGFIDDETTVSCPGYYSYGDRVFRCWKRSGHGKMTVIPALAQSCDVFFYQVGREMGVERLAWYAKACGLGRTTGIALSPEADGLVPSKKWKRTRLREPWLGGETLNVAIGQGYNLVTPLQMAVLVAAVANGGVLNQPVLLDRLETWEGDVVKRGEPEVRGHLPADSQTLEIIRRGMWQAVNDRHGTAWYAAHSSRFDISGKTGTAQVVASPETEEDEKIRAHILKPHAWFVAFAPSDQPRIALAVVVEHGEHGSTTAGPIAKKMISTYLSKQGLAEGILNVPGRP
ncbi:MAG: penicillin-binding protein 2 [Desulfosudaceae bacterium]